VAVLIVEDDPTLLRILERGLRSHGFEVVAVDNVAGALALAEDRAINLVLLDTSVQGVDVHGVVGQLRARRTHLPVLLLTANDFAGDEDYLVKPFAFEELIAHIRAKTRRAGEKRVTILSAGDLRIDLLARCAWRGERVIDLPSREFALLEYFMRHPSRVLSRADILTDVWGYNFASESNLVDVYVRYLRNRIDVAGQPSLVSTVRGAGYQFNPPTAQ
jgi:DNA-binding response OmpR family regulator